MVYRLAEKYWPKKIDDIDEIFGGEMNTKGFYLTIFISVLIEFCGIFHLLIAMFAFGAGGSFSAAAIGYTISAVSYTHLDVYKRQVYPKNFRNS